MAETWERPRFPLTGRDVMQAGVPEGPDVGRILAEVEDWWVGSDFAADEGACATASAGDRAGPDAFAVAGSAHLPGDPAKANEDAFWRMARMPRW